MIIQILKEYSGRMEYKVLRKYVGTKEVSIHEAKQGTLLLPGILLCRMDSKEVEKLNNWAQDPENQLILVPSWTELNLKEIFNTSTELSVVRGKDLVYEDIHCFYRIEGKVNDIFFQNDSGIFGVHYRKDTGSGVITIITLPLFDYKLTGKHDEFRRLFYQCLVDRKTEKKEEASADGFILSDVHLYTIMLLAAGYGINADLVEYIRVFFGYKTTPEEAEKAVNDLRNNGFIIEKGVSEKSKKLIEDKKLKAFVNVLRERRLKDEW